MLLKNWDSYEDERKYNISVACWDIFDKVQVEITKYVTIQFTHELQEGKRTVHETLADDIEKEVEMILLKMASGTDETGKISSIREKLQQLITPISN